MEVTVKSNETFDEQISKFDGFTEINVDITKPVTISTNMESKPITLLVGLNNSGKSFIQKLIWSSTLFLNTKIGEQAVGTKDETRSDKELFQFILDKTFTGNNITGNVELVAKDDLLNVAFYSLKFEIEDGKITNLKYSFPDDAEPMETVIYLSKDSRDFSNLERYLKTKKLLGIDEIKDWNDIEKLCEMWKIYDVFAFELLITKIQNANKYLEKIKQMAGNVTDELLDEFDLKRIIYDKETMTIKYENSKGEIKPISAMGTGTQSIISMVMSLA